MDEPRPESSGLTRDQLHEYHRQIVISSAKLLADHTPSAAYELSIVKEAERVMADNPTLRQLHTDTMIEARHAAKIGISNQREVDEAVREMAQTMLGEEHDRLAEHLNDAVRNNHQLKVLGTIGAALLLISAELHQLNDKP